MPSPAMSRRSFLVATGGLLALAACGGASSDSSSSSSTGATRGHLDAGRLSIEPYVSTEPQRFAFALSDDYGDFVSGPAATIAFQAPGAPLGAPQPTVLHTEGLPSGRGVYVVETPFPTAGIWNSRVSVPGHPAAAMAFEVAAQPSVPVPGESAPRAASPTVADTLGVDPICTRQPPCPLHTVSLASLIGSGRPVAVMFATPARCQSRYCGPVLDELLEIDQPYGDRIAFVHCEIYADSTSEDLVPTVSAWNLPGEPWLFTIDGSGRIVQRLDGAMGTDEVRSALDQLVS